MHGCVAVLQGLFIRPLVQFPVALGTGQYTLRRAARNVQLADSAYRRESL